MLQFRKHELGTHVEQVYHLGATNLSGSRVYEAKHGLEQFSFEGQLDAPTLISLVEREHPFEVAALGPQDVLMALKLFLIAGD